MDNNLHARPLQAAAIALMAALTGCAMHTPEPTLTDATRARLAQALQASGDPGSAAALMQGEEAKKAPDPLLHIKALLAAGEVDEAMAAAKAAVAAHGDDLSLALGVGRLAVTSGRLAEAGEFYQHALAKNPDNTDAMNGLGIVMAQKGDLNNAANLFRQALVKNPNDVTSSKNLALTMILRGQPDSAVSILEDIDHSGGPPRIQAPLASARDGLGTKGGPQPATVAEPPPSMWTAPPPPLLARETQPAISQPTSVPAAQPKTISAASTILRGEPDSAVSILEHLDRSGGSPRNQAPLTLARDGLGTKGGRQPATVAEPSQSMWTVPPPPLLARGTLPAVSPPTSVPAAQPKPVSAASTVQNADGGRIVLRARSDSWVRVSDSNGQVLLSRKLRPGETWPVPTKPGLLLTTGNAGGTELVVDGVVAAPLGGPGMVRRDVTLDPDIIKDGKLPAQLLPAQVAGAV